MNKPLPALTAAAVLLSADALMAQTPPASPQGFITAKAFTGITGVAVANLTGAPKFPDSPDILMFPSYFELHATGDIFTPPPNDVLNNYGTQIRGYFYPPVTGNYVFYLASDDNSALYLSPDANPDNKKLIAQESNWSNPREYFSSGGNSVLTSKDSSQFTGTQWETKDPVMGGATITLQANQPYYIEALAKEGSGGDNLSVAVSAPDFSIDYNAPIPGQFLSSDRTLGAVTIVEQPQSQSVDERGSVTFSVQPDGTPPYTFQWRRDGVDILDATNLTYTIPSVAVADNDAKISVVVSGGEGTATSTDAVLTVVPDAVAPTILSAKGMANLTEVVLTFSEPLDQASAEAVANYTITNAGGTLEVTGASLSPSGTLVTLTTAPQTLGTKYTVRVTGVQDTAATPNTVGADTRAVFFPTGELGEQNGMIVFEVENYDRNLDGLWVPDTTRGSPSGGVSMVVPNGAGGSETATQLEYDVQFSQPGTYVVWYRASAPNGEDDSAWFWLDGARPVERSASNDASMTGFSGQADFVWRSDAQSGADPFTVDIATAGQHVIGIARREDGAFMDKMILTRDTAYTPTGFGPAETREGAPAAPTVSLTSPTAGQEFPTGTDILLSANATGDMGLEIVRVEFLANGNVVGEATSSPFTHTWQNAPEGIYGFSARATDEIGGISTSASVIAEVGSSPKIAWVSFHPADGTPSTAAGNAGFTNAPDAAYTELLASRGYKVSRVLTTGNPNAALLNEFDLVIISRSVPSGDYETASETAAWNSITAPTMILGGYVLRNSRLGFTTGGTMVDTVGPVRLTVTDPNHPIFEGLNLDNNNTMTEPFADAVTFNDVVQRGVSVNTDSVTDGATVLATIGTPEDPTFGGMVIGEWEAGAIMATAAGDVLGGDRLVFLTGSREDGALTAEGAGIYDLTPAGAELFSNAVAYMSGVEPAPERPTLAVSRTPTGLSVIFTGTLEAADSLTGSWTAVPDATSPYTVEPTAPQRFYRARQ